MRILPAIAIICRHGITVCYRQQEGTWFWTGPIRPLIYSNLKVQSIKDMFFLMGGPMLDAVGSRAFARNASTASGLNYHQIIEMLDERGLGLG